ncbi:efflux RND transporter permease subunit [Amphibiibacter pelophylacis]|uniref:Efflux RND transporter permease subunit n=1 Tax=Amphibiibacter pelophylacis TaxID=1799477 RepID=A0ACC6NYP6_9BURK
MQLMEISIRRPVLATVMSLIIVLIGLVSFDRLSVREYPAIEEPVATIAVTLTGAAASVMETQVTKPIEDAVATIEGTTLIKSQSRAGESRIQLTFSSSRKPSEVLADIRDAISKVRRKLPADITEPVISQAGDDATPTIYVALTSPSLSQEALSDLVANVLKTRLQSLDGVADIQVGGQRTWSMRVWLDAQRMAALGITVPDVAAALQAQNLQVPAGRIDSVDRRFTVDSQTDLRTPAQFAAVVLRDSGTGRVTLGDIARIEEGPVDTTSQVRFNGQNAVSVGVIAQSTANPLQVAEEVRSALPVILKDLPRGVSLDVANDNAVFIERSIESVWHTIAEAVVLVALVIFFFLRTVRASIIPLVTIPVSLIGAFALMSWAGFSLNTLTLLALVLAIGLVVDDAIVVLENIYRHIEEGMTPVQAAFKGSREIGFAVIAMTLTLASVFAPLAFTEGRTGKLFIEFALTLAGTVIVSGFIALTLTPMMCSRLLRPHKARADGRKNWLDRGFDALESGFGRAVTVAVRARWLMVLVLLAAVGGSVLFFQLLPKELAPGEDRGVIIARLAGPDGATPQSIRPYVQAVETFGHKQPEIDRIFSIAGTGSGQDGLVFFRTSDWSERSRSTAQIATAMEKDFGQLAGVDARPVTPAGLGRRGPSEGFNIVIQTTDSYEKLIQVANRMLDRLSNEPALLGPRQDLQLNNPQLSLTVDRDKAAALGVDVSQVAASLQTLLAGSSITRYMRGAEQFDVIVQLDAAERSTPQDIGAVNLRSKTGAMVPLSALVKVEDSVGPRELKHFGQRRAVNITANLAPGVSQAQALELAQKVAAEVLPPGYTLDTDGPMREFLQSANSLNTVFALALLFIFLVLAAQFESFIDPFIVMLCVPLALLGALLALWLTGGSLSVFSQIGLIALVGIITKNGILIVEFANQQRELRGLDKTRAAIEAATLRLRPILMTSLAMILGALPLALASGAGAESRSQIGWVIVGGMTLGTLLTLFVVPALYVLVSRTKRPLPVVPLEDEQTGRHTG